MNTLFKTSLTLCMAAIVSACASNKGNFDLNDVAIPKLNAPSSTHSPQYEDVPSEPRPPEAEISQLQQPALGFEMKGVRRNWHPRNRTEREPLNPANLQATHDEQLGGIPHLDEITALGGETGLNYINDGQSPFTKRDFRYIQTGYVLNNDAPRHFDFANQIAQTGAVGYLFYKGVQPATALPTGQTVKYRGTWDYMSDAVNGRGGNAYSGDRYSAFSSHDDNVHTSGKETYTDSDGNQHLAPIGHSSEFEVNFDQKTLSGKLYRHPHVIQNKEPKAQLNYEITAQLYGNRFRGDANAVNKKDDLLGKHSSTVEGGFYGANAEELAGKFLTDDHSLFAVFGAKQEGETAPTVPAFDAQAFVSNDKTSDFSQQSLTQFGHATQLIIEGETFSLLPEHSGSLNTEKKGNQVSKLEHYLLHNQEPLKIHVCCHHLDYVKFGRYFRGDGYRHATLFLVGERTPMAEIPTSGFARYQGTWEGEIKHKAGNTWYADANDNQAIFNVNFDQKTIKGVFNDPNRLQPVLTFDGSLQQNGFTGTAQTHAHGFNIDPGNTIQSNTVHVQAKVQGGFYGKNANELGGTIFSNEANKDKIAATFGAKRQQLQEK